MHCNGSIGNGTGINALQPFYLSARDFNISSDVFLSRISEVVELQDSKVGDSNVFCS